MLKHEGILNTKVCQQIKSSIYMRTRKHLWFLRDVCWICGEYYRTCLSPGSHSQPYRIVCKRSCGAVKHVCRRSVASTKPGVPPVTTLYKHGEQKSISQSRTHKGGELRTAGTHAGSQCCRGKVQKWRWGKWNAHSESGKSITMLRDTDSHQNNSLCYSLISFYFTGQICLAVIGQVSVADYVINIMYTQLNCLKITVQITLNEK